MTNFNPSIFKAYDIRGIYPHEINEEIVYKIAQAYAKYVNPQTVVLGRDVRVSGSLLMEAAKRGLVDHGVDVVDIGVVSTDMMYFAVAGYGYDGGLQVTASHNPAEYNGMKLVKSRGEPLSGDSGIPQLKELALSGYKFSASKPGNVLRKEILEDYVAKVLSIIDREKIKRFKVVANINFGFTAAVLEKIAQVLPLEFVLLNEEPDGSFPKGRPDPLIPENREETIALIKKIKPDFGVAWDADADRVFFFDENGRFLSGYFTTAFLAEYLLQKNPGSKVVIDMKLNWAILDSVKRAGGTALTNKTGHSFFKQRMIRENAVFGGEVSAHYYFRDFFYLDNGIIPLLLILEKLSHSNRRISEFYVPYFSKYFAIEETNVKVADIVKIFTKLKEKYSKGQLSEIDGVAIEYPDWRFSVRSSNTESLVRLNLEARSRELMEQKAEDILSLIRA